MSPRGLALVLVLAAGVTSGVATAQGFPIRSVRIVSPYAAGGSSDTPPRILAQKLSEMTGQTFFLENRPGASGVIGMDAVARAAPDGHTVVVVTGAFPAVQALLKDLPFDINRSFRYVAIFGTSPTAVFANARVPARSLKELVALARANPDRLTHGSPGTGTGSHLAAELLKQHLGVQILHVPYKGSGALLADLLGGQIDLAVMSLSAGAGHIRSGKVRLLAVGSAERSAQFPDVPTVDETYPGYRNTSYVGFAAPAATPHETVQRFADLVRAAATDEWARARLFEAGLTPAFVGPADFAATILAETHRLEALVARVKIRMD